ncbi:NAD(P)-binding protein [Choiromyces venosus 120613-1]|uniref:NAD(P)-binding protein n=1 Tax=Choiromyces venosus 120613-1 TaxID=1336337 RepID=A0A3N4JC31_9PEZI|nr:NAD(P)-binding protein [Choiromyces venosus 120613-1]
METVKNVKKAATSPAGQFQAGHSPLIQHQPLPGVESKMKPRPRAIATLYAMEGADVAIAYPPAEESDAQYGRECHIFPCDVSVPENCRRLVEERVRAMGGLDVAECKGTMGQNLQNKYIPSLFYLSKYARPHMRPGSCIINNASVNHCVGEGNLLDYSTTKGAIVAFARSLAMQLLLKGVRVNCVAPGPIWTPLVVSSMTDEELDSFGGTTPLSRAGQPSEVATCFVSLASADSSFIAGQTLHPNGGVIVNG